MKNSVPHLPEAAGRGEGCVRTLRELSEGIAYTTKAEHAHVVLSEAIMSGILRPGQRVIAAEVARDLNMSVIPVREAFRRLEQESLVEIVAHVGARVRSLPVDELDELLMIRGELEGLATRLAIPKLTEEDIQKLRSMVEEMDLCANNDDPERYGTLNRWFHMALYEVSGSRELMRLIEGLWDRIPRAKSIFTIVPNYMEASQREHWSLLDALVRRDSVEAERLIQQQKLGARKAVLAAGIDHSQVADGQ